MSDELSLPEIFERYLNGNMSQDEQRDFELQLATDKEMAEKFWLDQEIDRALAQENIMCLRKQLDDILSSNPELLEAGPMLVNSFTSVTASNPETDQELEDLRTKLNKIHYSVAASEISDEEQLHLYLDMRDALTGEDELTSHLDEDIERAILQEDIMNLRMKLDEISQEVIPQKSTKPLFRRSISYISSAAAVIILVVAGTLILNFSRNSMREPAYAAFFKPYVGVSTTRGPSDDIDKIRMAAIELYNEGDFSQAGNLLDAVLEQGESSKLLRLYAGACALQNQDPDKGIRYLSGWDMKEPTFIDAQWYLAGCYLMKNEREKALAILEKLLADSYFKNYPYPADKLIRKLKRE